MNILEAESKRHGLRSLSMLSGAAHDAQIVGRIVSASEAMDEIESCLPESKSLLGATDEH